MEDHLGKKIDLERLVEKYISRMEGEPDAMRLLLNMLVDNVTDINALRNYIIKHEFQNFSQKPKADKSEILQKLSEEYGLSKRQILEIVEG